MIRYLGGSNISQALIKSQQILKLDKIPVLNYILENRKVNPNQNLLRIENEYHKIINNIQPPIKIALKLSSFNFNYHSCYNIIDKLVAKNIQIMIDAESSDNNHHYQQVSNQLINNFNKEKVNIYKTYQMYRKDSLLNLQKDIQLNNKNDILMGVKMVRGAYWNSERYNQQLFTNKNDTDFNYNNAIILLYENKIPAILATHNQESINLGCLLNERIKLNLDKFEFAHLLGMNEKKYNSIKNKYKVNVYIPYGPYQYMIPYLIRRLYENLDTVKFMI